MIILQLYLTFENDLTSTEKSNLTKLKNKSVGEDDHITLHECGENGCGDVINI